MGKSSNPHRGKSLFMVQKLDRFFEFWTTKIEFWQSKIRWLISIFTMAQKIKIPKQKILYQKWCFAVVCYLILSD